MARLVVPNLQSPLIVVPLIRFASDASLICSARMRRVPLSLSLTCAAGINPLNHAPIAKTAAR